MVHRFFHFVGLTVPVTAVGAIASLLKINQMGKRSDCLKQQTQNLQILLSKSLTDLKECSTGLLQATELINQLQDEAKEREMKNREYEECIGGLRKAELEAEEKIKALEEKLRESELKETQRAHSVETLKERVLLIENKSNQEKETIEAQEKKLRMFESKEIQRTETVKNLQKQLTISGSKTAQQVRTIAQLKRSNRELKASLCSLEKRMREEATPAKHDVQEKEKEGGCGTNVLGEDTEATQTSRIDFKRQLGAERHVQADPRSRQIGSLDESIDRRGTSGEQLEQDANAQNKRKRPRRRAKNRARRTIDGRSANENRTDRHATDLDANSTSQMPSRSLNISGRDETRT
ncbi:unnamed protein product [Agarophyton chilense]|eukprot:gb/GEZJ01008890.1/.p1 GENE.gb/GEZJ01008890.1/~~gb/GEZJ01008890.1/.p1  ORF type:complete len:350 (-),score=66.64 gb/GEZJ01008890.1/:725-1774(-)